LAKPVVDGLERNLEGKATVLRLDAGGEPGGQAAAMFGVRGVPTLVLVDGSGRPLLIQSGLLKPGEVLAKVDELLAMDNRRK
jgi:thioredoxin-like negative regulator of GroEL